jgi:hypothetical protein
MNRTGRRVTYHGITYRSLTEVRFARFLATIGVEWRYEPGAIQVDEAEDGRIIMYRPDFILPEMAGLLVEVKPNLRIITEHAAELDRPVALTRYPQPVLIWFADDAIGLYVDRSRFGDVAWVGSFVRCADCNRVALCVTAASDAVAVSSLLPTGAARDKQNAVAAYGLTIGPDVGPARIIFAAHDGCLTPTFGGLGDGISNAYAHAMVWEPMI